MAFTWSNDLSKITTASIDELKNNLNWLYDNKNPCPQHNSLYNSSVYGSQYSKNDSSDYGTVY